MLREEDAVAALLTETRIRANAKSAMVRAAEEGMQMLQSAPRPLKDDQNGAQGPKEGGVAALVRHAVPDLRSSGGGQLSDDHAVHTGPPLGGKHVLHLIVGYCEHGRRNLAAELIAYGESLGNVPVIIGADWNELAEGGHIAQAIQTGRWADAAEVSGDDRLEPTTHRGAREGRRVDFFLANAAAKAMVRGGSPEAPPPGQPLPGEDDPVSA